MSENDPAAWSVLGQIAGPIALLISLIGGIRRLLGKGEEEPGREDGKLMQSLALRMGLTGGKLQDMKCEIEKIQQKLEPLGGIQNQLAAILSVLTPRSSRRETPNRPRD